ncbi:hypothetical protein X727_12800 [Mesorhizobium sp. L103C119B0]|uniref:hypothetical protein n=1 Tax=Mesorhizobium sp. L103C119B0 TaxID=1287085 RepID=UPI0003D008FB|nr:hypothetical protein [Mesorhizobium sp. L103C119B0]ESZ70683.1 hypothetical protein X727_12800 [Mesorhizobium sp. L103C119B0]
MADLQRFQAKKNHISKAEIVVYPTFMVEILKEIYRNRGWIDVYQFHERYRLSPVQVLDGVDFLQANGISAVERSEASFRIKILPQGIAWIDAHAPELFLSPRADKGWRYSPERPSRAPEDFYVPRMSNLELDFLTKLGEEAE